MVFSTIFKPEIHYTHFDVLYLKKSFVPSMNGLPLKNADDWRGSGPTLDGMLSQPAASAPVSAARSNKLANTFLTNLPPHADMVRAYAALRLTPLTQQQQQNIVLARRPTGPFSAAVSRPPGV